MDRELVTSLSEEVDDTVEVGVGDIVETGVGDGVGGTGVGASR
jgi:hypothetical protein